MVQEIKIPTLGESVNEGLIVAWLQEDGALVEEGTPVLELETDKVTMEIVSPFAGRLTIKVPADTTVAVGQVVATVDAEASAEPAAPAPTPAPPAPHPGPLPQGEGRGEGPRSGLPQARAKLSRQEAAEALSPAVRRMVTEHQVDPSTLEGTGLGGRITKGDVVEHLKSAPAPEPAPTAPEPVAPAPPRAAPHPGPLPGG